MANATMIVSSTNLVSALSAIPKGAAVCFSTARIGSSIRCVLNGGSVGLAQQHFEPFTVDSLKAHRLRCIVVQLEEQPITLVWDGEHFTIKDFVI